VKVRKAVITAAGRDQRTMPLQRLVDRDGVSKLALQIVVEEAAGAGVEEIAIVVCPGDEAAFRGAAGDTPARLSFIPQAEPLGYGHALGCAREFAGGEPFLHLVSDHLYVSRSGKSCARQLVEVAEAEACAVSAVQATREANLPYYGAVGGHRVPNRPGLYQVENVLEKPTPTEAEQKLLVPGLRAGHYLCFFGMHVLTPAVMEALGAREGGRRPHLSEALAGVAARERYLALELDGARTNLGVKYGLLSAQLALALSGRDREEVLARLLELLARQQRVGA
jgi:UTP--glucose-1-phosphate uridylyltransferase